MVTGTVVACSSFLIRGCISCLLEKLIKRKVVLCRCLFLGHHGHHGSLHHAIELLLFVPVLVGLVAIPRKIARRSAGFVCTTHFLGLCKHHFALSRVMPRCLVVFTPLLVGGTASTTLVVVVFVIVIVVVMIVVVAAALYKGLGLRFRTLIVTAARASVGHRPVVVLRDLKALTELNNLGNLMTGADKSMADHLLLP